MKRKPPKNLQKAETSQVKPDGCRKKSMVVSSTFLLLLLPSTFAQSTTLPNGDSTGVSNNGSIRDVPQNVILEISQESKNTALLSWDPVVNSTDIDGYLVNITCDYNGKCCPTCNHMDFTQETNFTFELYGNTNYEAKVAAYSSEAQGIFSMIAKLKTDQHQPNDPNVTVVSTNKSLEFEWKYACPYTGPVDYLFDLSQAKLERNLDYDYRMPFFLRSDDTCKDYGQRPWNINPYPYQHTEEVSNVTEVLPVGDECSYIVAKINLEPYKAYEYSVLATNRDCPSECQKIKYYPNAISTSTDEYEVTSEDYSDIPTTENTFTPGNISTTNLYTRNNTEATPTSTNTYAETQVTERTTLTLNPKTDCSVCHTKVITTLPDVPGRPKNLRIKEPSFQGSPNYKPSRFATVSWDEPDDAKGQIDSYTFRLLNETNDVICETDSRNAPRSRECECNSYLRERKCMAVVDINSTYSVQIRAKNCNVSTHSPPAIKNFTTGSGWPYMDGTPFDYLSEEKSSSFSLHYSYPIHIKNNSFDERNGRITKFQIILMKTKDAVRFRERYYDSMDDYESNGGAQGILVYSGEEMPPKNPFVFGTHAAGKQQGDVNNEYLDAGTRYYFKFRLFSYQHFTESATYSFDTEVNIAKIVLLTLFFIVLIMVIISFVGFKLYQRYLSPIVKRGESMELPLLLPNISENTLSRPLELTSISDIVSQLMVNGQSDLRKEYLELKSASPSKPKEAAQDAFNVDKNRYMNILPFDETRVILNQYRGDDNSDFINASYIHGYNTPKEFIACQGPRKFEVEDFWRMVWEKNVHVIVMVTRCVERGAEKCYKYWPDKCEIHPWQFPRYNLSIQTKSVRLQSNDGYNCSDIKLSQHSLLPKSRTVKHFHYTLWPDMDCPKDPDHLINFVKSVKRSIPNKSSHTIVHCSAGVGRTGTFIALSNLMEAMEAKETVDIFQTVHKMRHNRENMVQTMAQYAFLYKCIERYHQMQADREKKPSEVKVNMIDDIPDVIPTTFSALNESDEDDPYDQEQTSYKSTELNSTSQQESYSTNDNSEDCTSETDSTPMTNDNTDEMKSCKSSKVPEDK